MTQIRVFKDTKKRANEFAQYTDANGVRYPNIPRDLLEWADVAAPPVDYSEDTYYRTEQDDAPYVVYTQKSPEQIAAVMAEKVRVAADETSLEYAKAHPVMQFLSSHTPIECEAWVNINVTDLASAKTLLKNYAIALCVLARREFRE